MAAKQLETSRRLAVIHTTVLCPLFLLFSLIYRVLRPATGDVPGNFSSESINS